jgi:hypothetical protein
MMFTTHGHHIPGTERLGTIPSSEIEACDPRTCETCQGEIALANVDKEIAFHYAVAVAELFEALRQEVTKHYAKSREQSLVLTNLDQAELWLTKCKEVEDPGYLVRAAQDEISP